jgi:surface antigen
MSFFGAFSKKLKVLKSSLEFFRTFIKTDSTDWKKTVVSVKKKIKLNFAFEHISALFLISCILFAACFSISTTRASGPVKAISEILAGNSDKEIIEEKYNLEKNPALFEKAETKGLIFADLIPSEQEQEENSGIEEPLILVQESFVYALSNGEDPNAVLNRTEPFKYIVKAGDVPSTIAELFGISTNTVLWANSLNYWEYIKPGDELLILPVSGLQHEVIANESVQTIANKYKADPEEIIAFNMLSADGAIAAGQILTIPGGKVEIQTAPKTNPTGLASVPKSKNIFSYTGKVHNFPYGYCTYYVSTRYPIPWSGHAKSWLVNSRAYGFSTGSVPQKGSIVVTSESWWGHVAIVESVSNSHITVSEMNYKGWGKTSIRSIPINSKIIRGYIYIR